MPVREILRPGRNCSGVHRVDSAGIVIDGKDYYRMFYHAASSARNYILISGWQFDSNVSLLRGEDLKGAGEEIRFLGFLNALCEANPGLRVYILAWNFSLIYILEREWKQKSVFRQANPGIQFHFDNKHAFAASQHQKFIVIDGAVSFVGGMDICSSRWDDRRHLAHNPHRIDYNGRGYGPYHDVNSYQTGPAAAAVSEVFIRRWSEATGTELKLPPPVTGVDYLPEGGVALDAPSAAISTTQARSLARVKSPVREIRSLYIDAIRSARTLIYIENQYFSSMAVYRALVKRMKSSRGGLQIVLLLPKREQTFIENVYVGVAQNRLLKSLKRVARRRGHRIGIYYPSAWSGNGVQEPVFIHSKLMIVDDRFMTIGSANANNRSMGLDTELNVSWEAASAQPGLAASIKKIRVELLSEHIGAGAGEAMEKLGCANGLVDYLDEVADSPLGRLRRYRLRKPFLISSALRYMKLDRVILDPERAVIDENIMAAVMPSREGLIKRGVDYIKRMVKR